jgi:hypothetical protein
MNLRMQELWIDNVYIRAERDIDDQENSTTLVGAFGLSQSIWMTKTTVQGNGGLVLAVAAVNDANVVWEGTPPPSACKRQTACLLMLPASSWALST